MADIYSPAVLNRVVADLRDRVQTFLVSTYFSEVSQSLTEEVYFDVLTGKPRLSPFVSPFVEGQVVQSLGYTTKSFRPAYIKDKRVMEDARAVRRLPGQPIFGPLDPMAARELNVARETEDQLRMLSRRLEWMAAQVLLTGAVTISGEKYPSSLVSFGRDAALTVTLSGTARWGQSAQVPLDDLQTWQGLIRAKSGAMATDVIMANNVYATFVKNADVKALLAAGRFSPRTQIDIGPQAIMQGANFMGPVGAYDVWVYADSYVDENGATQNYIPDNTVLLVSKQLEGVQHYGVIKDEKAGFQPREFFSKSWIEEDPAVRFLMLQSAPLIVPYRINATLAATVM